MGRAGGKGGQGRRRPGPGWGILLLAVLAAGWVQGAGLGEDGGPRLRAGLKGVWPPLLPPAGGSGLLAVRVVTFNIRHGRTVGGRVDLAAAAGVLERLRPDLAGLQEVDRRALRSGLADQGRWLARRLGMEAAFAPAFRGPGGAYGNALLSRWPVRAATVEPLPGPGEPRVALVAAVDSPAGILRVVVTHLATDRAARRQQAEALAVRLARGSGGPTLVLGDFNALPGSPELAPLLAALGEGAAEVGGAGPSFPATAPLVRLDHIYVSGHWRVRAAWTDPGLASDHLAVAADLVLGRR